MSGSITVRSTVGEGSTFVVYLSLRIEENPPCYPDLPPLRVLIDDDDALICEYAVQTLDALGLSAECAENGSDTINRVVNAHQDDRDFDVLILDWKMPGADGLEVTRQIRAQLGEALPILIASSYDWADIRKESLSAGANDFVSKPLFKSTLCHTLKRADPWGKPERQGQDGASAVRFSWQALPAGGGQPAQLGDRRRAFSPGRRHGGLCRQRRRGL